MQFPKFVARFNARVAGPLMVKVAALLPIVTVVRHVGRKSGRQFQTPIQAFVTPGGAATLLPYGTDCDWIRNLQASGGGSLVRARRSRAVAAPRVVTKAEAMQQVSPTIRFFFRLLPVDSALLFTWA